MKVQLTQYIAQAQAVAWAPSTRFRASTARLQGAPTVISRAAPQPFACSRGSIRPQLRKVTSIAALTMNSPPADSLGDQPATFTSHGPIHNVCSAIMPP
jgi:hypothetical protein